MTKPITKSQMTDDLEKLSHTQPAPTEGMVTRTIRQQADRIKKLEAALRSIAANACCDSCREAALEQLMEKKNGM